MPIFTVIYAKFGILPLTFQRPTCMYNNGQIWNIQQTWKLSNWWDLKYDFLTHLSWRLEWAFWSSFLWNVLHFYLLLENYTRQPFWIKHSTKEYMVKAICVSSLFKWYVPLQRDMIKKYCSENSWRTTKPVQLELVWNFPFIEKIQFCSMHESYG